MRQDIVNVVNKLAKESGSLDFELKKAYQIIFNTMKETKKRVTKMKICLVNGCIFIDGNIKGRVVPMPMFKNGYDEVVYAIEEKILVRQENYLEV